MIEDAILHDVLLVEAALFEVFVCLSTRSSRSCSKVRVLETESTRQRMRGISALNFSVNFRI